MWTCREKPKLPLKVTPGFWLMAAALFYLDGALVLWAGLAAALHELGHLGALKALGAKVGEIRLSVSGAEIRRGSGRTLSYGGELAAAIAGPVVSLLCALLAAKVGLFLLAGLSLSLGVFNLLPITPLDGGRALQAGLSLLVGDHRAAGAVRVLSVLAVGGVLGLGAAVALRYGGLTLLLMGLWLLKDLIFEK